MKKIPFQSKIIQSIYDVSHVCSEEEIIDNPADEDAGCNADDNVPVAPVIPAAPVAAHAAGTFYGADRGRLPVRPAPRGRRAARPNRPAARARGRGAARLAFPAARGRGV